MRRITIGILIALGLMFIAGSEGHVMPVILGVAIILLSIAAAFDRDETNNL